MLEKLSSIAAGNHNTYSDSHGMALGCRHYCIVTISGMLGYAGSGSGGLQDGTSKERDLLY